MKGNSGTAATLNHVTRRSWARDDGETPWLGAGDNSGDGSGGFGGIRLGTAGAEDRRLAGDGRGPGALKLRLSEDGRTEGTVALIPNTAARRPRTDGEAAMLSDGGDTGRE